MNQNVSPAQQKVLDALRSFGKPYAGGSYATHRDALPGFKIGPAEALVRKGLVLYEFNVEEKRGYYSIAE